MGNAGVAEFYAEPPLEETRRCLGDDVTAAAFARRLAGAKPHSVVVVCGAGISVSAGIPDFRTPGSGLYDNLQKYALPRPESIFTLTYFRENPLPFFQLAKEMYPGKFAPTPTHVFLRLLQDKKLLRRCFTQNIDTLERLAGVSPKLLVEAHGSFGEAHCLDCKALHETDWVREEIFSDRVPVRCPECQGLVKPDIVFFGEGLPKRFEMCSRADLPEAELLIVLGTSLSVEPFASTVNEVSPLCPRLLINRERVGVRRRRGMGFRFDSYDNYRDVAILDSCDAGVRALAEAAGWGEEFEAAVLAQQEATPRMAGLPAVGDEMRLALERSWCRRLLSEVPSRQALCFEDMARTAPDADGSIAARICLRGAPRKAAGTPPQSEAVEATQGSDVAGEATNESDGAEVVCFAGGETVEFAITLFDGCWGGDSPTGDQPASTWLGFVPYDSSFPAWAGERAALGVEANAPGAFVTSLTVPPLRKPQVEAGETPTYEVWLARESAGSDGSPNCIVAARAGPLATAAWNVEGVGVANNFARLAVKKICRADSGACDEPAAGDGGI
mmetsp:Transcript_8925/g.23196  ORF Transcript_8925/g.23196 Transcript_8925/m.23196 type:complete len:558 (-) Transcript_8925:110-1783(-)